MAEPILHFLDLTDERWVAFVERQADANIFHHPAWASMLARCYNFRPFALTLIDSDGTIRAGVPIAESNRLLTGRRWISLPFSDHSAPLADDSESLQNFFHALQNLASKSDSPSIEIRWQASPPASTHALSPHILHTMRLESDFGKVTARIHRSHLRNVRNAQNNGVRIERCNDRTAMQKFYDLNLRTRHRQGVPVQPMFYFELLDELILQKGLGFILLAYRNDTCLAGAVFLHWKQTLTYKYGASVKEGLHLRPNHLIFWNAIQWGCENGFSQLDFGRTDLENAGLCVFKNRWGADETPLRYSYFPPKEQHTHEDGLPKRLVRGVIQKTPPGICKLCGQLYYRYVA